MSKLTNNEPSRNKWWTYLFYGSFLPFIGKGISYLLIGAPYIFVLGILYGAWVIYSVRSRPFKISKIVGNWGRLLMLYAMVRLVLVGVVFSVGGSVESAIVYQLTPMYYVISVVLFVLGYFIVRNKRLIFNARA